MKQKACGIGELPYELWLCSFPDMGNGQRLKLSEHCGGARGAYFASIDKWREVLKEKQVEALKRFTEVWRPEAEAGKLVESGIRLVTLSDSNYPQKLKEIPDAPYGLFVRGNLPGEELAVAVVGARDCSQYGGFVAQKLGEELARGGITVVSGMARGVDGISQQAALDVGGRSCGVLGCGVDVCYPKQNRELYDKLSRRGCLVSSYPLGTPALSRNFPPRNRIVSGLADAVVVVEARQKSGTLITVDMALEQGREVFAVPGRITDRLSDGCNRLIRQGASPVMNPEELLVELRELEQQRRLPEKRQGNSPGKEAGLRSSADRSVEASVPSVDTSAGKGGKGQVKAGEKIHTLPADLTPELTAVCRALDFTPGTVEEIRSRLPQKYQDLNLSACLIRLCMEGQAVQVSPGCFCGKF